MDNLEFANRISKFRREKGLSQKELGDLLNVSNKAVSKWENGESLPKTSTMLKLAKLLDIDGNELIGLTGNSNNDEKEMLSRLESENAALKSRLDEINNNRKKLFYVLLCVILLCLAAATALILIFSGSSERHNNGIEDAGEVGTKIVFSEKTFVPISSFEEYFILNNPSNTLLNDERTAFYYALDGSSRSIAVNCSQSNDKYVSVKINRSVYMYKSAQLPELSLSKSTLDGARLIIGSRVNSSLKGREVKGYYYFDSVSGNSFLSAFCEYYNGEKEIADSKITSAFMGNEPLTVEIYWSRGTADAFTISSDEAIGEFFRDNEGNAYFYDYTNGESYAVGKELSKLVYDE